MLNGNAREVEMQRRFEEEPSVGPPHLTPSMGPLLLLQVEMQRRMEEELAAERAREKEKRMVRRGRKQRLPRSAAGARAARTRAARAPARSS